LFLGVKAGFPYFGLVYHCRYFPAVAAFRGIGPGFFANAFVDLVI
jgi:hypothetical protein